MSCLIRRLFLISRVVQCPVPFGARRARRAARKESRLDKLTDLSNEAFAVSRDFRGAVVRRRVGSGKFGLWVSFLALMWLMAGGVGKADLCFGAEGDVRLEYSCKAACGQNPGGSELCPVPSCAASLAHGQNRCIDLPVYIGNEADRVPYSRIASAPQYQAPFIQCPVHDLPAFLQIRAGASLEPLVPFSSKSYSVLLI